MLKLSLLSEQVEGKLKHIDHAEDRPILYGKEGFDHTYAALTQAHNHIKHKKNNSNLTMKYDGSPAIVFGHHPETGSFFVASKSAFNKNPKINYTDQDIERNHGHAPGLVSKLKDALHHLPKVSPRHGVYQGDLMFSGNDVQRKVGTASFTPNTITYTAKRSEAEKIKKAKLGIVVHQKYNGATLDKMKANPMVDDENFNKHTDVWSRTAEHDTSKIDYSPSNQKEFVNHLAAAKKMNDTHQEMYGAIARHGGHAGHLPTFINNTVRTGETPSVEGFRKHVATYHAKAASKLKSQRAIFVMKDRAHEHDNHIVSNKEHYKNLFAMHHHLQMAKNVLVNNLEQHEGDLTHKIAGKESKPEGFVVNHAGEPTKLINRAEFARQNLLKVRG